MTGSGWRGGPGTCHGAWPRSPGHPAKNTQEGGCCGRATAPLEPGPFLIPSWLLSHRGWQLLMGAGCPQGASSSREESGARGREVAPHPGPPPPPPFPVWHPFLAPSLPPPSSWGVVPIIPCPSLESPIRDICVPAYPIWDNFQHHWGPRGHTWGFACLRDSPRGGQTPPPHLPRLIFTLIG